MGPEGGSREGAGRSWFAWAHGWWGSLSGLFFTFISSYWSEAETAHLTQTLSPTLLSVGGLREALDPERLGHRDLEGLLTCKCSSSLNSLKFSHGLLVLRDSSVLLAFLFIAICWEINGFELSCLPLICVVKQNKLKIISGISVVRLVNITRRLSGQK